MENKEFNMTVDEIAWLKKQLEEVKAEHGARLNELEQWKELASNVIDILARQAKIGGGES